MRAQLRFGSTLSWIVAWALAVAAPVVYLIVPGDVTWWLAPALLLPLFALASWRQERQGRDDHDGSSAAASVWGPPGDHPGF